jgi:hypothetical protein
MDRNKTPKGIYLIDSFSIASKIEFSTDVIE